MDARHSRLDALWPPATSFDFLDLRGFVIDPANSPVFMEWVCREDTPVAITDSAAEAIQAGLGTFGPIVLDVTYSPRGRAHSARPRP